MYLKNEYALKKCINTWVIIKIVWKTAKFFSFAYEFSKCILIFIVKFIDLVLQHSILPSAPYNFIKDQISIDSYMHHCSV